MNGMRTDPVNLSLARLHNLRKVLRELVRVNVGVTPDIRHVINEIELVTDRLIYGTDDEGEKP
jgi:hypothetical protein